MLIHKQFDLNKCKQINSDTEKEQKVENKKRRESKGAKETGRPDVGQRWPTSHLQQNRLRMKLGSSLRLNSYFITTFNKNQQVYQIKYNWRHTY